MPSTRSQMLLDAFDDAARQIGWGLCTHCEGAACTDARAQYEKTKLDLTRRLRYLERHANRSLHQTENV